PPGRAEGGVEHLGADAVVRLVLEPLIRVPAAGAHLPAGGVTRPIRKARGAVPERGRESFLPQGRWLCHVRVARDALLAAYGGEGGLWHVCIIGSGKGHGFLHSMARLRPLPKTVASLSTIGPMLSLMRNRAT